MYGNYLPNLPVHRITSARKMEIMMDIFDKGFMYDVRSDNDFATLEFLIYLYILL